MLYFYPKNDLTGPLHTSEYVHTKTSKYMYIKNHLDTQTYLKEGKRGRLRQATPVQATDKSLAFSASYPTALMYSALYSNNAMYYECTGAYHKLAGATMYLYSLVNVFDIR